MSIVLENVKNMSHTNAILQNIPVASTATGAFEIAVLRIHGKGRPTVTSKILLPEFRIILWFSKMMGEYLGLWIPDLPIELETAISPRPFFATITDVMRSGTDVPAARKVNPIISIGILAT